MEAPAPSPDMVTASRRHLTERYASGVDRLLWDTEKRLVPDLDAIRSVIDAASSGHAEALDIGAGLVLLQAVRLEVDRLEHDVFEGAHAMGMGEEAIAAVLDLPDAAAASKRRRWLKGRWALPYADIASPGLNGSAEAAKRAGRRAGEAADRAAGPQLRHKGDEYHQAAVRYREMAERYRSIGQKPGYRQSE
jgi:hypothetical protein